MTARCWKLIRLVASACRCQEETSVNVIPISCSREKCMSYCAGRHGFFWAGRGQRDRTSTRGALHPQLLSHSWWCMKYECNQWEVQRVDNSMMCKSLRKLTMWMSRLLRLDFGLPRFSTEAVVILMHVVAAPCAGSSRRAWFECAGADLSSWAIGHVDFSGIISMDSRWSCLCR